MKKAAYCGIDCVDCQAHLATKTHDDNLRRETATEWSRFYDTEIKPEQIYCEGCKDSGVKFYFCDTKCKIKNCCIEKKLDNCAQCEDYACDLLNEFFAKVPEAKLNLDSLR
ncbi:DUF3795 domain-containing protein [candidate division KSB1 bacterium]